MDALRNPMVQYPKRVDRFKDSPDWHLTRTRYTVYGRVAGGGHAITKDFPRQPLWGSLAQKQERYEAAFAFMIECRIRYYDICAVLVESKLYKRVVYKQGLPDETIFSHVLVRFNDGRAWWE